MEVGDELEGGFGDVEIDEEGFDGRVGEAGVEHFDGADGASGDAEGVGDAFDFGGPDEVCREVEEHVRIVGG